MSRPKLCDRLRVRRMTLALALLAGFAVAAGGGDDFPDVVCTDLDSIWVYLGDPAGGFQVPEQYFIGDAVEPWSVAVGDLNSDGLPEIVSANRFGPHIAVFWNQGEGIFDTIPMLIDTPERPYDVDLGDLNGDESLDIVVTCNYDPGAVYIFWNDEEGGFLNPTRLFPGEEAFNTVLVDLDGWASLDLVVVRNGAEDLLVYMNDGGGDFEPRSPVPAGTDPKAIRAADFNGDGFADVAVTNDAGGTIRIFLGDGSGGLAEKASYAAGVQPRELVAVDLDLDGAQDLMVVGGRNSDYVCRFLGRGDGTFYGRLDSTTGPRPNSIDAADLDLDGFPDVAVANWSLDNPSLATMTILYGDGLGGFSRHSDFVPAGGFDKLTALAVGQLNQTAFLRGDTSGDRVLQITDPVLVLRYLFDVSEILCLDSGDADDNTVLEVTDAIRILMWLFLDGPAPRSPFPDAGFDPTPDLLGCDS